MDLSLRTRILRSGLGAFGWCAIMAPAAAAADHSTAPPGDVARRLQAESGARVAVSLHRATGVAHLLTLEPGAHLSAQTSHKANGAAFLDRYGSVFGVTEPGEQLERIVRRRDILGHTHDWHRQLHRGIPVFGAEIRLHFDSTGALLSVNGVFVPDIAVDPVPFVAAGHARRVAAAAVAKQQGLTDQSSLYTTDPELLVYRTGLMRSEPGRDHLAWQVEVGNGKGVREILFIDAHDGSLVEQIDGIHTLTRVVHQGKRSNVVWREGDPLPYSGSGGQTDEHINQLIATAAETFRLFENLSAGTYLSWDGADRSMISLYDPEEPAVPCPNAWWDGQQVNFCPPLSVDDVVAHEWTHAYTQATHVLAGGWQVGALNESFSDIFGEIVDLLNETGADLPDRRRDPFACSLYGSRLRPELTVDLPRELAGTYPTAAAEFNPPGPWSVSARVELVDDGSASPTLACEPFVGFSSGSIALIDRGGCLFIDKVGNAQNAGASGVIVANNDGDELVTMGGDGTFDIPSVFVSQSDGELLRGFVGFGLRATIALEAATDDSRRWLIAEEYSTGFRDMWNPGCYADPGKVSDANYWCSFLDSGGIHANAGVPNHAFALVVDGGSYNGRLVEAIGLTKAAHIYWRAMSEYQVPLTDFAQHADLVELSCADLIGATLTDLVTGAPSSEVVNAHDCRQVASALLAVEARVLPSQCNLATLLDPDAPLVPGNRVVFFDDLDSDPWSRWRVSNQGVTDEYLPRDWEWTTELPQRRTGGAFFALDSGRLGTCVAGDDQSGVMSLDSSPIVIPQGTSPVLSFDHYVATESQFDGGNVKISVNGGPFELIEAEHFLFNPYNDDLNDAAVGRNTNPMAGEGAFSGTDLGVERGSWGQSQIALEALVTPGDTIRLRFDFGVDGCNGVLGWFVDNVRITTTITEKRGAAPRFRP